LVFEKALLTKVSALGGAWASYEGETRTNYSRLQRLVGIWRCAGALGMAYPLSILIFLTRCFFLLQILIAQFQGNGNWGQSRLSLSRIAIHSSTTLAKRWNGHDD